MRRLTQQQLDAIAAIPKDQRMAVEAALNINRDGTIQERRKLVQDLASIEEDVAWNLIGPDADSMFTR
jgi:hypothetical protein